MRSSIFPGLSNTWTMPIENRLDMELTGIKTPVGIKIQGPNLEGIQQLGGRIQQVRSSLPEMRSIFAERVAEGFYVNIEVNRAEAARYGLTVGDIQRVITSGIGGDNVVENEEGRQRYPVSIRYAADFRASPADVFFGATSQEDDRCSYSTQHDDSVNTAYAGHRSFAETAACFSSARSGWCRDRTCWLTIAEAVSASLARKGGCGSYSNISCNISA